MSKKLKFSPTKRIATTRLKTLVLTSELGHRLTQPMAEAAARMMFAEEPDIQAMMMLDDDGSILANERIPQLMEGETGIIDDYPLLMNLPKYGVFIFLRILQSAESGKIQSSVNLVLERITGPSSTNR